MRVLLACPWWVAEESGVGAVVRTVLAELRRRGHEVFLLRTGDAGGLRPVPHPSVPAFALGLRLPRIPGHPVRAPVAFLAHLPLALRSLVRLVRRYRIDVVNVHYPVGRDLHFALCRRLLDRSLRLVVSLHGADVVPPGAAVPPRDRWLELTLRGADRVTVPSRAFLDSCARTFPWLVDRTTVVHNGLPADEVPLAPPAGGADRYLLCIAAHNVKKGLDVLLAAFARLVPEDPALRLRLVGEGPLRADLEALARRLGVAERVDFVGRLGRADVARALHGCLALVLPSRAEPFGVVLVEAMLAGRAVVATRCGGIPEVVVDEVTGLLIPPEDPAALAGALARVAADPALRDRLGEAGRARALGRFSASALGDGYEEVLAGRTIAPAAAGDAGAVAAGPAGA